MRSLLFVLAASVLWAQTEDAASKAERARKLVVAGKLDEAILIYQELARAHPKDAGVMVNLSIVEFKAGHYHDAAAHAASAVKIQPESVAANLFLGSSYVQLGEYSLAVAPLEWVIAAQPQERNAHLMLGEALLNLEHYEDAAAHFQKVCELAPENPKAWYGLGRTFEALSARAFYQLDTANPDSPYRNALAADLYLKQRRYGSAFSHYRAALDALATLPGVHVGLATVYQRTGHAAWAEIEEKREHQTTQDCSSGELACDFAAGRLQEIVQGTRSVTTPEARYWACKAYAAMARDAYRRLAQLPPSLETHLRAAKTYDAQGLDREAASEWRQALKLNPGDVGILTALAWSLFRGHQFRAVLPLLTELLKHENGSRDLNFLYGACLVNLDEPQKAIVPLEAAIQLDENFLPAQGALGRALLQSAKPSQAIPHLKIARALDEDASTHFQLLRAYQLTGKSELAAQAKVDYQNALIIAERKRRIEEGAEISPP